MPTSARRPARRSIGSRWSRSRRPTILSALPRTRLILRDNAVYRLCAVETRSESFSKRPIICGHPDVPALQADLKPGGGRFKKVNYLSPDLIYDKSNEWAIISTKNFSAERKPAMPRLVPNWQHVNSPAESLNPKAKSLNPRPWSALPSSSDGQPRIV